MATGHVSITQLMNLEDIATKVALNFGQGLTPKTAVHDFLQQNIEERTGIYQRAVNTRNSIIAGGAAVTFGAYLLAPLLAAIPGTLAVLGAFSANFFSVDNKKRLVDAMQQKEKAERMSQQGFIFANELGGVPLVPSYVDAADYVYAVRGSGLLNWEGNLREVWYAVREGNHDVTPTKLSDLHEHVNKPVILEAAVSSSPQAEDTKTLTTYDLRLEVFMFSGTIKGVSEGEVCGITNFRIDDSEGLSVPAAMDYYNEDMRVVPPFELRRANPNFSVGVRPASRNQVLRFLDEAHQNGKKLRFMGKPDPTGTFHVEALGDPATKEMYMLNVYQGKPQAL